MELKGTAKMAILLSASVALLGLARASSAALVITEVDAGGSSQTYAADWFEVTNTGASAVDMSGYGVVDSHVGNGTTAPSTLSDTTIPAGGSAVFMDASGTGTIANFESAWFGSNVPSNFIIGTYGPGASIGLSTGGDQVNLFLPDLTTEVYGVTFGANPAGTAATPGATFDNSSGAAYTGTNITLSTLSAVGVKGAFTAVGGTEIGSPGTITTSAVPEPTSLGLLALGGAALLGRRRRRA